MEQWYFAWRVTRMNKHSTDPIGRVVARIYLKEIGFIRSHT